MKRFGKSFDNWWGRIYRVSFSRFLSQDYDVYVLDNYRTGKRENIKNLADDHVFELDIREYDAVEQIMKKYQFEYIIHLAALVSVAESVEKPILSQEINVVATLRVLETIKNITVI